MRNSFGVFLLSAALLAPVAARAYDDHDRDNRQRYYDSYRHDYHQWNSNENRAYRRYLDERHEQYRDWARANSRQQREYWRWRHSHPDRMLWDNGERSRSRDRDDRR